MRPGRRLAAESFAAACIVLASTVGAQAQSAQDDLNASRRLYQQGRYAEAEAPAKRALGVAERQFGPDHPTTASMASNLARLHWAQGRYAEAEPLYRRALAIQEKSLGPDHAQVGASLNNIAVLYWTQGRYGEAEALQGRALAIREKALGPEHAAVGQSLNNLAALYRDQGRYGEAEALYGRTLAIREKALGPGHADVGQTLNNLALLYWTQGRYAEAEPLYKRALAIRERALGPGHSWVGTSLNNLGELYRVQGRYAEAEPMLRRALAIREKALGPEHADVGQSLNNLALLFWTQGRYAEAEPFYERALAIRGKALGPDHPTIALYTSNLARLYERQGRIAEALSTARRATTILRRREIGAGDAGGTEPALGARPERTILMVHLSIASRAAAADPGEAQTLTAEALEVAQLASVSSAGQALARTAARYATGNGALAKRVRDRQDAADRRAALDKALVAAVSRPPAQRNADQERRTRTEIEALGKKIGEIDARLRREFPNFAELSRPEPLALKEVQALLAPDEALLAFVVADDASYRFVVRRDKADFGRIAVKKTDLDKLTAAVRAGIEPAGGRLPRFDAASSHRLYETLLASAAPMLAGASRLLIVPDGPLMGLPFSILATNKPPAGSADPDDYRRVDWLMRRYAVSVLPAVGSLKALRVLAEASGKAPQPFAGFGDPALQGRPGDSRGKATAQLAARGPVADVSLVRQLEPLPESAQELDRLAKVLGGKDVFVRAQATERRVKTMDLSKYRVLAFATHAIMAGEFKGYGEPALVLTPPEKGDEIDDGLLGASEVAALKLNAEWVVLSACNTAAPDGTPGAEGLSGLARAFFYAGSRALLVSHWPVASDAAVRLSTGAFDALAEEPGIGRAEALRRSMLSLLDDTRAPAQYAHPAVWAPFSLVGEGGAGR